ncbi:MAG: hypothetical protein COW00_05975 [Bdellovibrio sp. CG12_big_fil_rev_8_21_14_0_65_39_13]|nr:MAG: hypothetical protein COW78_18510 [Bdellovibrio sp. CG22_combo_CG10-13_8_21_14_all_39_27]PIQ60778.1 MAG: hypothetical protein COW00_05975 [Bdellovibrio sp. CG12_big_fil_rev_8_21_14_0_65_39_13]PIR36401.1 MAG: hypothetical protein COV37_03310 [Bdellovibrio sp. CG11_big_fil_rev_8_21_14_0_20_39_38]PJB54575.1 MAG: hypothetical protein CO099_00855 [Bdellovibrio sp. CG_4_9_14_3_um_filter_39_7]
MNSANAIVYLIVASVMLAVVTSANKQKSQYAFFLIAFIVSMFISNVFNGPIAMLVLTLSSLFIIKDENVD